MLKHKTYENGLNLIVKEGGAIPSEEEILKVIPSLCGKVMQTPPIYSAKNINGKNGNKERKI